MFDEWPIGTGDQIPGIDVPRAAGEDADAAGRATGAEPARPGRALSRPWLAEDRCFQEVIASLPGGATLAQVLPRLLSLAPAGEGPEADDGGQPWGGGLPVWFVALQQCLEPLPGVEQAPGVVPAPGTEQTAVAVGTAPIRVARTPVGGLVDPARSAVDEERTADALAAMPTAAVVEVVAGYKRIEAWAASQAARAAAALAGRDELDPCLQRDVPAAAGQAAALRAPAVATGTLAKRLGTSEHTAGHLVRTGLALNGVLYATGETLATGAIDWPKAQALATALAGVPWHVAHAVEDRVLPKASSLTPSKLRHAVSKALLVVDPDDAAQRHTRARAERRVERPTPLPDGMALVRAVLPADGAVRLDATLQAAAKHAKAAGDPRTMDQLRADSLDALATRAWQSGAIGPSGCDRPCCTAPASGAVVEASGSGILIPSAVTPVSTVSNPASGGPLAAGSASGSCSGPCAFADLLGPHAPGAPRGPMKLAHHGKRAQINVTVDLTTLLGLNRNPGTLSGYGPISADMARILARDGTWRRLITDPITTMVIDVATDTYRPPANLDELVRLRHPTCVDPVCSVPSDRCDLDHLAEWTPENPDTSAPNLAPLCRTHHLHKTHAGYHYEQPEPGTTEITTPTGHRYRYRSGTPAPAAPDPGTPDAPGSGRPHTPGASTPGAGRPGIEPSDTGTHGAPGAEPDDPAPPF